MASGARGLELTAGVGIELTQRPALSPLAVQVLSLLRLPHDELASVVAERVDANPALRVGQPRRCAWCGARLRHDRCPACAGGGAVRLTADPASVESPLSVLRREARTLLPARAGSDAGRGVDVVLDALDDGGLLRTDVAELATAHGLPVAAVAVALEAVRTAGPPGIAAASATACVLEQARWHAARGGPRLLVPIVEDHLASVAAGDHDAIAAALGTTAGVVDEAVRFLRRHLRPYALTTESLPTTAAAPPDVIIRGDARGRLVVDVLGAADLGVGLDAELAAQTTADRGGWLAEHVAEARALIHALDRRAATLRRVATVVVDEQRAFLSEGPRAHRALTRTQVATMLGLHVSTVSRAVDGKVARLPDGQIVPMSLFFEAAVPVKDAVARLLQSDPRPTSDADLASRLRDEGFTVARRTVAKYRLALTRA